MKDKNSNKRKTIIDKYIQPIYVPHILYVCKNYTKDKIDKLFEFVDGSSIFVDNKGTYMATTCYGVKEKATNKLCIVVLLEECVSSKYKKDKDEVNSTVAHEAFHVADEILKYCEISLDEGSKEAYAYMVGWAAECIFKTVAK